MISHVDILFTSMYDDRVFHNLKETLDDGTFEELGIRAGIGRGKFGELGTGVGEEVLEVFFAAVEEL